MATFNLIVTYPDAQQARILAAFKKHWTTQDPATGADVVPTTAQVIEKLRLVVVANVRDIVLRIERDEAVRAASDAVVAPDVA